jgi:ribosomal-protein-alanine N-acetyltransferase
MTVRVDESTSGTRSEAGRRARRGTRSAVPVELRIRRLTYGDLPQVIAIERRSFPAPWSLAMFVLELSKPSSACVGATLGGELVGYVICSRYHTVWHLMNVAVDPAYRRTGVAKALISRLLEETGAGGERHTLEVRVSNLEAIAMYESFGFRSAGIRRRYYHDNNEDALIMWRSHPEHNTSAAGERPSVPAQSA